MNQTVVFLASDGGARWLTVAGGRITGEGLGLATLPVPDPARPGELIAAVPGEPVVLHWVELPPLAPAQTAAAARLLAADVATTAMADTHVAVGTRNGDGMVPLALVARDQMAEWLAMLAAAGVEPDRMVPAPLLLPLPETGVTVAEADGQWLVRGAHTAFAAEPALAEMLIGDEAIHRIDDSMWRAGLAATLAALPVDLRQGGFARVRRQPLDRRQLRRVAMLALGLLGLLLATQVAGLFRANLAANAAEQELASAAQAALPRGTIITDPRAQVAARLAALGGENPAFTALAGPVLVALRDRPTIAIDSLAYAPETGLTIVIASRVINDPDALETALAAAGLAVSMGPPHESGGRQLVDVTVRGR